MQTEPTYVYIKGKGWQLDACDSFTGVIGKWKVTVYARAPEIGEYSCWKGKSAQDTFSAIVRNSSSLFQSTVFDYQPYEGGRGIDDSFAFVIGGAD